MINTAGGEAADASLFDSETRLAIRDFWNTVINGSMENVRQRFLEARSMVEFELFDEGDTMADASSNGTAPPPPVTDTEAEEETRKCTMCKGHKPLALFTGPQKNRQYKTCQECRDLVAKKDKERPKESKTRKKRRQQPAGAENEKPTARKLDAETTPPSLLRRFDLRLQLVELDIALLNLAELPEKIRSIQANVNMGPAMMAERNQMLEIVNRWDRVIKQSQAGLRAQLNDTE